MKEKENFLNISDSLRKRAEAIIEKRGQYSRNEYSESDLLNLIYELEVYKIELEMQNEELHQAAEMGNELLKLTVQMNSMESSDYSKKLELALSSVGQLLSSDRAYIFELNETDKTLSNTFEWCRKGIQSKIANFQNISTDIVPMWMEALREEEYIFIPSADLFPKTWDAESEILARNGVLSLLVIPILIENKLAGFVGLDKEKKQRDYSHFEINTLKTWSNIFAGLIINRRLETIVEQTRHNYENFFNTIDDFLIVANKEGSIIHTNDIVTARLGYTKDELIGNSVLMLHSPERQEEANKIISEMLPGKANSCPIPLLTKSGIQIPVEIRMSYGEWDGKPAMLGVLKDMSQITISEEKFSKVFHLSPSASTISELDSRKLVEVNRAFSKLLGFNKEDVIGKTVTELGILSENKRNGILSDANEDGSMLNAEVELFAKNGDQKYVLLSGENIYIQDKQYRYSVAHDITERRLAELAIYNQNEKINAIISATPDGIGIISFDGKIKFISDNLAVMYGYSIDEKDKFIGTSFFDFCDPSDHVKVNDNIKKLLGGSLLQQITEYQVIRKDKSLFYVGVKSTIIKGFNGSLEDILFVQRDVTQIRETKEALGKSEAQLKTLINTIPDLIWLKDSKGVYLACNQLFERFLGQPSKNIIGKTDYDFFEKELAEFFRGHDRNAIHAGTPTVNEEWITYSDDGHRALLETIKTPMYNSDGTLLGVLGIGHDITERNKNEIALKESELKLNELNASKDKFLSILGHDLKSPLATINGFSHLLLEQIAENNREETELYASVIQEASQKAMDLVNDLMQWSRSQSGKMACNPETLEVGELISSVIQLLQPAASKKKINIYTDYNHLATVSTDRYMVETILRNLISNAIKFTNTGGKIVIKTFQDDKKLTVSVADNGIGIAQEKMEKLFRIEESFTTPGTSNERGTGLGLLLCKEFLTILKGKIWVESEEGKGTTMLFSIPMR